jgi:FdhD protein
MPVHYVSLNGSSTLGIEGEIVAESLACISVNGKELATLMCSPHGLEQLAIGFLYNEGIISGMADVRLVQLSRNGSCVDVWLYDTDVELPSRAIVTAGCGGGVTFDDLSEKHDSIESELSATPGQVARLMRQMHTGADLYKRARGIHTAALASVDSILLQVEDVGRHNCLDKLQGEAMSANLKTRDHILLSSGRISSEMVNKARRMGTPIVCSRTSPTSLSVALAKAWNMTLVAYVRQRRMRLYSHPERILPGIKDEGSLDARVESEIVAGS